MFEVVSTACYFYCMLGLCDNNDKSIIAIISTIAITIITICIIAIITMCIINTTIYTSVFTAAVFN